MVRNGVGTARGPVGAATLLAQRHTHRPGRHGDHLRIESFRVRGCRSVSFDSYPRSPGPT